MERLQTKVTPLAKACLETVKAERGITQQVFVSDAIIAHAKAYYPEQYRDSRRAVRIK